MHFIIFFTIMAVTLVRVQSDPQSENDKNILEANSFRPDLNQNSIRPETNNIGGTDLQPAETFFPVIAFGYPVYGGYHKQHWRVGHAWPYHGGYYGHPGHFGGHLGHLGGVLGNWGGHGGNWGGIGGQWGLVGQWGGQGGHGQLWY